GSYLQRASAGLNRWNQRLEPFRCLSGNAVKLLAVATMFVDHFSKIVLFWVAGTVWFPMLEAGQMTPDSFNALQNFIQIHLYGIGSMAFPLFCFLLVEGFCHTRNRRRYFGLMALFALISELPFDWGFFAMLSQRAGTYPFYWGYQNVFFTLFLGLCALWCLEKLSTPSENRREKIKALALQIGAVAALTAIALLLRTDYAEYGVILIAAFYLARKNPIVQALLYLLILVVVENRQPGVYQLLSMLILLLYNGQRGKLRLKYSFYLFYPIHLALLRALTVFIPPLGL
ncbi:MAG: TraX family protein, partial [Oscillibacter sp.]